MKDSLTTLMSNTRSFTHQDGDGNSSIGLFLSLYLILLGFFIVLTAVSEPVTDRSKSAMDSVNGTFKEIVTDKTGDKAEDKPFPQASEDKFLLAVNQALSSELSIEGRFATYQGNVLDVSTSVDTFFERGALSLDNDRIATLEALVSPLLEQQQGKTELKILFSIGSGDIPVTERRSDQFMIMRSVSFRQTLLDLGLKAEDITTGMTKGNDGEMRLIFRHIEPVKVP